MVDYEGIQSEQDYDRRADMLAGATNADIMRDWRVFTKVEALCIHDALANGEDVDECLAECRHWRSPNGRWNEAAEAIDSGRF